MAYTIIKASGQQKKVSVDDELLVEKVEGVAGEVVELPTVLMIDGDKMTSKVADMAKVRVSVEVLDPAKGPKISIVKFRNEAGCRKR